MKQVLPKLAMPGVCTRDDDVGNGRAEGCAGVSHDPENSDDGSRGSGAGAAGCCAAGDGVACAWCACLCAWRAEDAGDDDVGGGEDGDGDGACGEVHAAEADVGV